MSRISLFNRVALAALVPAALSLAVPAPAQAAAGPVTVSLTFNDGLVSQYVYGAPVLAAHNVQGTFYVASSWMASNDAKYLRSYQLDALYRAGNEIGGMGKDHKDLTATYSTDPAVDAGYKQDQVCGDRQRLSDLGYAPVSFSYPFSAWSTAAASVVRSCGYLSGRVVGGLSATGPTYSEGVPPANPFNLRTAGSPNGPVSLASLQNAVTAAANRGGGWLPIAFNQVCDSADPGYSSCMSSAKPIDDQVLAAFLDWAQSSSAPAGTTFRTVRAMMGSPDQPPLPARPTSVSLTFDDADITQFGVGDVLAAHGVRGTFFVNSGAVDAQEPGAMSWAQIDTLAAAGNEIGGHTRDHVNLTSTATSYDFKWHQVCDDRARLVAKGYDAVSFAYPEGAFNSAAAGIVKGCGYQSARTAGSLSATGPRYAESFSPADPYAYQALGTTYNGPITLQVLQDTVSVAMSRGGGWIPMVFHKVCYAGTASYDACMGTYRPVDSDVLGSFLTWVNDLAGQNLSVRTVADVLAAGRVAPRVRVTSPTDGGVVTTSTHVVTGTAVAGSSVQVAWYAGRYSVGTPAAQVTAMVAADGSWTVTSPPLANGVATVQAAESVNGVTGTSPPVTFTVSSP